MNPKKKKKNKLNMDTIYMLNGGKGANYDIQNSEITLTRDSNERKRIKNSLSLSNVQ